MRKTLGTREEKILRELLKEFRENAGLTQRDLAARLNTIHTRVSGYEHGQRRMDLPQLHEYMAAMGVPLQDFVQAYLECVEKDAETTKYEIAKDAKP